jgi:hypothetical protein
VTRKEGATRQASAVDFDNPDLERFPLYRQVQFQEAILEPGDLLFIPQSWWHYLRALEPSISLSIDWIEDPVGDLVSSMLQDEDPARFAEERAGCLTLEQARNFPGGLATVARALADLPADAQALVLRLADVPLRSALTASAGPAVASLGGPCR